MLNPASPTALREVVRRARILVTVITVVLVTSMLGSTVVAAPGNSTAPVPEQAQNVDWMSSDTAAALDVGIDVMVPTWIPAPFSGMAPSVSASGGYYQLYWMIGSDSPTFLYVEGVAGGTLPAGSPADLNKELSINSSVQGWSAIHDVGVPAGSETPIYDQVWWIANGVLYTVSSNNMTGTDTMSLANSLVVLQGPTAPEPAPTEPMPTEPPYVPPTEPAPVEEVPVEQPQEPGTGPEPAPDAVDVSNGEPQPELPAEPTNVSEADEPSVVSEADVDLPESDEPVGGQASTEPGEAWSPSRGDANVPSDGTSGPLPPVVGGDGTGGLYDNALPRIRFVP